MVPFLVLCEPSYGPCVFRAIMWPHPEGQATLVIYGGRTQRDLWAQVSSPGSPAGKKKKKNLELTKNSASPITASHLSASLVRDEPLDWGQQAGPSQASGASSGHQSLSLLQGCWTEDDPGKRQPKYRFIRKYWFQGPGHQS